MILTVIGTGFVGVVTSAVLAKFGNTVFGLDIDAAKVGSLSQGRVPFFEPQLESLLKESLAAGNLKFTTSYEEAIGQSDIIMIAVGTPSAPDGTADLAYVFAAAESMAPHLKDQAIVAIKSTVPPGTHNKVAEIIKKQTSKTVHVVSLPEFLREGTAVADTMNPDRVVIGATDPTVIEQLLTLHQPLSGERVIIDPSSAQMAKYTANAYLAMRITFINQIANLCEKNEAKISEVVRAIGFDKRIGTHYWYPGLGYGGSCFPKDVKELAAYATSVGEGDGLLVKINELNEKRIDKKMLEFDGVVGGFEGKTVAVLGLSFKPNTNDMREAPALKVIPWLQAHGAKVRAYDPKAMEEAKKHFADIAYASSPYQAAENADVIMILIEWPELVTLDLSKLKSTAAEKATLIDTRNQYDAKTVLSSGMAYISIGNS